MSPDEPTEEAPQLPDIRTIDPETIDNAVLRRLIAEVQQDATVQRAYDRVYSRHNRNIAAAPPDA